MESVPSRRNSVCKAAMNSVCLNNREEPTWPGQREQRGRWAVRGQELTVTLGARGSHGRVRG